MSARRDSVLAWGAAGAIALGAVAWGLSRARGDGAAATDERASFIRPQRASLRTSEPLVPPEVPSELEEGPARVLISLGPVGPDWLFVRNPVDPRRVSATMIDHRARLLVEYDESELRNAGIARGWADVAGRTSARGGSAAGVDALADAVLQHPGYRLIDAADYREKQHEHRAAAHPASP